jgi:hypothetical protein
MAQDFTVWNVGSAATEVVRRREVKITSTLARITRTSEKIERRMTVASCSGDLRFESLLSSVKIFLVFLLSSEEILSRMVHRQIPWLVLGTYMDPFPPTVLAILNGVLLNKCQAATATGKSLGFYMRGSWIHSRPAYWLYWLGFSLDWMPRYYLTLGQGRILPIQTVPTSQWDTKIFAIETESLTLQSLVVSICTTRFNTLKLCILPTLYLCVPYGSHNKQRLFP